LSSLENLKSNDYQNISWYSKMSSTNHSVTPTYQSLLILGLDTVAQRLMDGDELGGWQALKTLYAELPPECQNDCHPELEAYEKQLEEIRFFEGVTIAETAIVRASAKKRLLDSANLQLFDKFKGSLYSKGYLEFASTKPRNPQPIILGASE
jgi:hypothetical protein